MCRLLCLLLYSAVVAEARMKDDTILKANQSILGQTGGKQEPASLRPKLEPESDKNFIDDYKRDDAPARNGLHFKHPYPVVQDGEDYDKDFVSDQNSDNGEFKAQQYYDELRRKMQKQYEKTKTAFEAKTKIETEYEETTLEFEDHVKETKAQHADDMEDLNELEKKKEESMNGEFKFPKKQPPKKKKEGCWWPWSMWCCGWWPWSCPDKPAPKPYVDPMDKYRTAHEAIYVDIEPATKHVEEVVNDLKECERELQEAKEELARLLELSKKAKKRKEEADKKVKKTKAAELDAEKQVLVLKKQHKEEVEQYEKAQAAYLKQKEKVEKMAAELKILAKKVEELRRSEDKNGGIYPVKEDKGDGGKDAPRRTRSFAKKSAQAVVFPLLGMLTLMVH